MSKRKAFNFYYSYYEVAKELSEKDRAIFLWAILQKQFDGIEPNLTGIPKLAYISQKFSIDSQVSGYEFKTGVKLSPTEGGAVGATEGGSVQEKGKGKEEVKEKGKVIPSFEIFSAYAIERKPKVCLEALERKYDTWVESDWHDGHGSKILNWKVKLLNTLPYIKERVLADSELTPEERTRKANASTI